jgi:hypothetical protein
MARRQGLEPSELTPCKGILGALPTAQCDHSTIKKRPHEGALRPSNAAADQDLRNVIPYYN